MADIDTWAHFMDALKKVCCMDQTVQRTEIMDKLRTLQITEDGIRGMVTRVTTLKTQAHKLGINIPDDQFSDSMLRALSQKQEEQQQFRREEGAMRHFIYNKTQASDFLASYIQSWPSYSSTLLSLSFLPLFSFTFLSFFLSLFSLSFLSLFSFSFLSHFPL